MCRKSGDVAAILLQFQLLVPMVHIKMRKYCGPVELICDIIKCRHDSVGSWNGFICFPHIHIQPYFIAGQLQRYNYRGHPTGWLLYPLNYVVSIEFLQFCFQLGSYTERYILLWACATGVIAGSTCKSTFTPFIFPIPRNRSAYSFNRLLVIVSSLWTVFATLTRPRSSVVWKPIKGSVFVFPFTT